MDTFLHLSPEDWEARFFLTSVEVYAAEVASGNPHRVKQAVINAKRLIDEYRQQTGQDPFSQRVEEVAGVIYDSQPYRCR